MSFKVLVPTAGIGSRLENLTRVLNKSLISVANRPVLSHIIEKYPNDCEFVIPIGYKGQLVKDFLELAYPKKNFIFEEINPFIGEGSGLGLTILSCKRFLKEPFVFHSCDTLVREEIPSPTENWMGYGSTINENINSYRTIELNNNKVISIIEKGKHKNKKCKPYIGLCGINDFEKFFEVMSNGGKKAICIGEVFGLKKLITEINGKYFTWHDTGQKGNLKKARAAYQSVNEPNILEKENECIWFIPNNKVIKFSSDKEFIQNRVKRAEILKTFVPEIIAKNKSMYKYKLIQGKVVSEIINPIVFGKLLNECKIFWKEEKLSKSKKKEFNNICDNFYKKKTYARLSNYYKKFQIIDKPNLLNGLEVPSLDSILKKINWEKIIDGKPGRFHGDFHFENIIFNELKNNFKFIDWRQDFGGDLFLGDIYYDLAKLLHGIIINHSVINNNLYYINLNDKNYRVDFDFHRRQVLVDCEKYYFEWLAKEEYDIKKIKILTGLIYLNIASLHHFPYCHLLYFLGKNILFQETN